MTVAVSQSPLLEPQAFFHAKHRKERADSLIEALPWVPDNRRHGKRYLLVGFAAEYFLQFDEPRARLAVGLQTGDTHTIRVLENRWKVPNLAKPVAKLRCGVASMSQMRC